MTGIIWTDRRLALLALAVAATACGEETLTAPDAEEVETPVVLEALSIEPEGEQLRITDALQLSVTGRYSDASESAVDPGELVWSVSSGADVVSVDEGGTVLGQAVGTARVRGEHPTGVSAELEVTVRPFAAEGDFDSPVAASLPYRGEVDDGMSMYRFDGLVPGETYTIEITSILGEISAYGVSDGPYGPERCRALSAVQEAQCPVPAGAGGEVYLIVVGGEASGSIYSLDLAPGGIPNEGSAGDPVDISGSLPYAGTVSNADSYYVIGGLSPGRTYTVQLTSPSDDVRLWVASSGNWGQNYHVCTSAEPDASDEVCAYAANADGEIHVRVYGGDTRVGASYTLAIVEGGFYDEGSSIDPLDVTGRLPYSGGVATYWSHYVVTGLVPGATYTVLVDGVSDDVSLMVWSAPARGPQWLECTSTSPGSDAPESCAAKAVNGELHIGVGGGHTVEGATFTLDVTPGGIAREGSVVVPLDVTGALPHNGSANRDGSFYLVTGLTPGTVVTVTVGQLTGDVGLLVEERDTGAGSCHSENPGTADESCVATAGPSGELHIRVATRSSVAGAYYVLDVSGS